MDTINTGQLQIPDGQAPTDPNTQSVPGQTDSGVHPMTDKIAQLVWALDHHQNGPIVQQPDTTDDPTITAVRPQIPGGGLLSMIHQKFTGKPIMYAGDPIMATSNIPDQSGIPDALRIQPIGKDAKGKDLYSVEDVQQLRKTLGSAYMLGQKLTMKDPLLTTVDQVAALNGNDRQAAKRILDANGGQVRESMVKDSNTGTRAQASSTMANAKVQSVANQIMSQVLQYGGAGAVQKSMQDAASRAANLQRSGGLYDIIKNQQAGAADKRQRSLYQTEIARSINPSGVLTNEALNSLATDSAGQKVNDWAEWFSNKATATDYTGFMTGLKQLADNELSINQGLFQAGAQMGLKVIAGNAPKAAAAGTNALADNPVLTTPPGQTPDTARNPTNPNDHSTETAYLTKIGAVISPANLKWARKQMQAQAKSNGR